MDPPGGGGAGWEESLRDAFHTLEGLFLYGLVLINKGVKTSNDQCQNYLGTFGIFGPAVKETKI